MSTSQNSGANAMGITYTSDNPYRISPADALYPAIYVQQVNVMRTYMKMRGPMWIQVLGCELRQYADLEDVKAKLRFLLCCNVNAEGDSQEFQRLLAQ
jgi:hypothetical protein